MTSTHEQFISDIVRMRREHDTRVELAHCVMDLDRAVKAGDSTLIVLYTTRVQELRDLLRG